MQLVHRDSKSRVYKLSKTQSHKIFGIKFPDGYLKTQELEKHTKDFYEAVLDIFHCDSREDFRILLNSFVSDIIKL